MNSVPKLRGDADRLSAIPGNVPRIGNFPPGCRFSPRCPIARPECSEKIPELLEVEPWTFCAMSVLEDLTNATMTFEKAKQEFEIRYYLWSISEFEKEIEDSFPNLQLFKAGRAWRRYQFMRLLIKKEQMTLAHSFLKRWHRDTVKILGEKISADEESLLSKYDSFFQSRQQYQYVQQLEKDGQSDIAHFWTQRLRAEAANIPSVGYFDNDKSLLSQLDAVFRLIPLTFEEQIAARKQTGRKLNL